MQQRHSCNTRDLMGKFRLFRLRKLGESVTPAELNKRGSFTPLARQKIWRDMTNPMDAFGKKALARAGFMRELNLTCES